MNFYFYFWPFQEKVEDGEQDKHWKTQWEKESLHEEAFEAGVIRNTNNAQYKEA